MSEVSGWMKKYEALWGIGQTSVVIFYGHLLGLKFLLKI